MNVFVALLVAGLWSGAPIHQVDGQVWTYDPMGYSQYIAELSSSSKGPSPAVAKDFDHPQAKGSYAGSANYVNELPRYSLASETKTLAGGGAADAGANYYGAPSIVVSGFGAVAPTKLDLHWTMSGGATGGGDAAILGPNSGYFPRQSYGSPNFVADVVKTTLSDGYSFSGTAVDTYQLTARGDAVYADFGVWAYADSATKEGSAFLDMIADSLTFPEFDNKTAEELGWSFFFGDPPPLGPPDNGGGSGGGNGPGGGGDPTPEPTSVLGFAAGLGLGLRFSRRRGLDQSI